MKRFRFPNLVAALGIAALSFGAVACGDDEDNNNSRADAAPLDDTPDAAPEPEPDAAPEPDTRTSTIAIADITAPQLNASGGLISIGISDATKEKTPVPDQRDNLGAGCVVWDYDLANGEEPPPLTDEGPIAITGTNAAIKGCSFSADREEYVCIGRDGATAAGDSFRPNGDDPTDVGKSITATVTIAGETFTASDLGAHLVLAGFDNAAFNGAFPIAALGPTVNPALDDSSVIVSFPAPLGPDAVEALANAGTYATVLGQGPGAPVADFVTQGASVNIKLAANDHFDAIDQSVTVGGEGFELDAASAKVDAIPTDGNKVTFSCTKDADDDEKDTCGGAAQIITVSGDVTNADLTGKSE